jgi:hypothetical protein
MSIASRVPSRAETYCDVIEYPSKRSFEYPLYSPGLESLATAVDATTAVKEKAASAVM